MHICHVITRLIVGGAQENTILSCEGLHEHGHEVTLISGPTRGAEGSLLERATAGGYRFVEVRELIRAINPWMDVRARQVLRDVYTRLKPDVVHTHSSKAGIVGRYAARDARVPAVVHTIHGMSFNRTQPWPLRRLLAWAEKRATRLTDRVVTVADAMIEQSVAAGICRREKMRTVYSGMEVERFHPQLHDRTAIRRTWNVGDDRVVVGIIARLFRKKGYEALIPIMQAAVKRDPRLHFVWVGDGAQRAEYESQLAQRGLTGHTTLVGLVPPEEVARQIAGFDILAHTSQWEGLPRAVVQGLLMCVPAVAFDIDGTPEVVRDNDTGHLVELGNQERFVDALVALADDQELRRRMGQQGRALCVERFDWRRMVDQLEQVYSELLRT